MREKCYGGYAYGAPRFGEKPNGNKELVEDSDEHKRLYRLFAVIDDRGRLMERWLI
jgi:hypothetical protein